MIIFNENFHSSKDGKQPYSVLSESTHKYSGYDASVKNKTLYIKRSFSKQMLLMPEVNDFRLSLNLSYSVPEEGKHERKPNWGICFGYNRRFRSGYKLIFEYKENENIVDLVLCKVDGAKTREIERQNVQNVYILPKTAFDVTMTAENEKLTISVFEQEVTFNIKDNYGIVALSKEDGVGEAGFSDIIISSNEAEKRQVWKQTFCIPRTDGGVLDYYLTISIDKYENDNELFEIRYELNGGAYENHTEFKGADCWVWEYDIFLGFYFSFGDEKFYLSDDKLVFVDDDYTRLKVLLGGSDIPFCGSFNVCGLKEFKNIFIGYDRRFSICAGNLTSDRMFTYDTNGNLLFVGKALNEECLFEVKSNPSKEITKRIPENAVDYADAIFHARKNHYFFNGETPEFYIDVYSKEDIRYLKFYAELENTWFEKQEELMLHEISDNDNIFEDYGYKKYSFSAKCNVHSQGVYHIKITCLSGSEKVYEHTSAFEIIDDLSEESPQETAGLPTIYCGDGFPTKYSTYDMATVRPDFNIAHYINGSLHIPYFAEKRRTWELLEPYHRKSFLWMTQRALRNKDETYKDYQNAVKHADYINYADPGIEDCLYYYRYETGGCSNFDGKKVRELYNLFLEENPELRNVFPPIENERMDYEKWARIPCKEYDKWVSYINEKVRPWFVEQWNEIRKVNPKANRFSYGPYPVYFSNHAGSYSTKWRGFSDEGLAEVFENGFMKLEDYPFVCGYQSHNCAWSMSTIKLNQKELCIAPDLYDSFGADCPDGAVGFANPPTGESYAPPYQTVTQLYEYLYNTAIFDNGDFRYWNDNFINIYDHISYEPEKRFEVFLRAWKIYLDNKPQRPLGAIAYITDFSLEEDRRTNDLDNISIYNRNQTAMSVIHEVNAEMGIPQGFVMKWESLEKLDESDMKIVILPSLDNVPSDIKRKLRSMYNNGCAMIATGSVDGLEDIFGVRPKRGKEHISVIRYGEQYEEVYPYNCEFFYEPDGADIVVAAEKHGVILQKDRAMILNASLGEVGIDSLVTPDLPYAERANISKIIRESLKCFIASNASPLMHTDEKCGINAVKTVNGETLITLTDYSPYSDLKEHYVKVSFDDIKVKKLENISYDLHDISLNLYEYNGFIDGFTVKIRPHETLIFKAEL